MYGQNDQPLSIVKGRHIGLARSSNIDVYILAYLSQLLHYRREEEMQEGGEEEDEEVGGGDENVEDSEGMELVRSEVLEPFALQ